MKTREYIDRNLMLLSHNSHITWDVTEVTDLSTALKDCSPEVAEKILLEYLNNPALSKATNEFFEKANGRMSKEASSACECSPPGDERVLHATEPNLKWWNPGVKNIPLELGARWIHGVLGNPLYELAVSAGLVTLPEQSGERQSVIAATEQGVRIPLALLEEVHHAYISELHASGADQPPAETGNSVGRHLALDIQHYLTDDSENGLRKLIFQHLITKETCITGCHSMTEVSLVDFGSFEDLPGGNVSLSAPYEAIIHYLSSAFPPECISTHHQVSHIDWTKTNDHITVSCTNGATFSTNHVIVTIPLGVLKSCHEDLFHPNLPEDKVEAISNLGFGVVDKIYLYYERPFLNPEVREVILLWGVEGPSPWYSKIFSFLRERETLLVAWLSGQEAEHMETLTDSEVAECCTSVLQRFLADPCIPLPCSVVRSRWRQDPHVQGSYSFIPSRASHKDIQRLASPIYRDPYQSKVWWSMSNVRWVWQPMLIFAGEATHPKFYSTTHGAFQSGQTAAAQLLVET
ncbi:PAOX [Cordylochernes scorpioides]|uniref:PAOX n=1 Tax=Cordylochernes scorpioides TaxID=51811 RepID=A0ABY6KJE1_9ARAC|nr:PAOX [Cordylochernes scorpioides]